MKLIKFNIEQLIRNKMPDIMHNQGIKTHERILSTDEFIIHLKNKLVIEATEAQKSQSLQELTGELADIYEIIHTLIQATGILPTDIEQYRLQKNEKRGSFSNRIYNHYVEIEESNPAIKYYKDRPDQYPEM